MERFVFSRVSVPVALAKIDRLTELTLEDVTRTGADADRTLPQQQQTSPEQERNAPGRRRHARGVSQVPVDTDGD
jgi:hypothetical protein